MINLSKIISKRASPGGLIFDLERRLIHANRKALEMISWRGKSMKSEGVDVRDLPDDIYRLLDRMSCSAMGEGALHEGVAEHLVMANGDDPPYSLCAFFLGDLGGKQKPTHIMVLMEKIIEKHVMDVEKTGNDFSLSKREREVLGYICQGLPNREIAVRMFICEYTVKDHVKNIMRKMCVGSRGGVIALMKE